MKKPRTRLLVLNNFQKWFIFNFVFYTALFLTVFGIGLFLWMKLITNEVMELTSILSQSLVDILNQSLRNGLFFTILLLTCLMIVSTWASLIFSRRIAGPLFAMARHLETCERNGKLTHLKIRKDDLFEDLTRNFNAMVDRMNEQKHSE